MTANFCPHCQRTFDDRQEFIEGLIFEGQVVSKGKRPNESGGCLHESEGER